MIRAALVLGATLLAGCPNAECGRPICGCWEAVSVTLDLTLVDGAGEPVPDISVICTNEDSAIATSNAEGVVAHTFDTRVSDGCGPERCNTLTLVDPSGRCTGVESTLLALNGTTIPLSCGGAADDDDSGL